MKVLIYTGNLKTVNKSGVGKAIKQQIDFLEKNNIPFTTDLRNKYDIVHLNTVFPDSLFVSLWAKLRGMKVVYHGHSTMEDFKNSFKGANIIAPLFKIWIKLCYSSGDIIITPTEYSREILKGYGIKKPVISISNGIDTEYYNKEIGDGIKFREKYGFGENDKIIMSVGLFIKRKGILDFIELAKEMPEYKFIWFGYTDKKLLPKEVRRALETELPNLRFPGYVSKEELRDAYRGSDMFLFLTHEETEGIVMLEALSMKIPVLVRDIPIYEKWLEKDRDVYKGKNIEDFKNKIRGILNGDLPYLCENGYERVKERDTKICGQQIVREYHSLMRNEKRTGFLLRNLSQYVYKNSKKQV